MKPLFFRYGSKRNIVDTLIKMIPSHKIYVEAFFGGGALYWNKEPSEKEIINDLDESMVHPFKLLKKINIKKAVDDFPNRTVKDYENYLDKPDDSNETIFNKNLLEGRIYFMSNMKSKLIRINYNNGLPSGFINILPLLKDYKKRIKNTTILNKDYIKVILDYDSPETFFYLDPPYSDSASVYKHSYIDYEQMAELLKNIKGDFLLSINDDPLIRKIFKGFFYKKIFVKSISHQKNADRTELLIYNYEI